MRVSKRIFIALFCFGLMFNQPAKAFWPVFDFNEIVPVYSQVSTGIEQLKSLKEQLKELEETFKALGKEVANIAAFAKDISNTISSAADMVSEGANLINDNLGTNITLGEKAQDLASKVSKANKEVATAVKGATENIAKGTKTVGKVTKGINDLSDLKTKGDKFMKEHSSYRDPNDPEAKQDPNAQPQDPNAKQQDPNAQQQDPNAKQQDPNAQQQDPNAKQPETKKKKSLKDKVKAVVTTENLKKAQGALDDANKKTDGKYDDVIKGAKTVVFGAEVATDLKSRNDKNKPETKQPTQGEPNATPKTEGEEKTKQPSQGEPNAIPPAEPVEEEEEEEEITEDEDAQNIEAIKENIDFALKESKALNVQFNDVLDISMNTIYQNIATNNKTIDDMIFVINKAENLTEEDKTTVKKEIETIKQRQENISVNLVDIINGMKESYNTSFKTKIEDGYKNYEKVAIAYIKGDVDEEEFMLAGTKMEKDIQSIDVIPDKGVVTGVNTAMTSLQKQLQTLSQKIRKMEQENQKSNS